MTGGSRICSLLPICAAMATRPCTLITPAATEIDVDPNASACKYLCTAGYPYAEIATDPKISKQVACREVHVHSYSLMTSSLYQTQYAASNIAGHLPIPHGEQTVWTAPVGCSNDGGRVQPASWADCRSSADRAGRLRKGRRPLLAQRRMSIGVTASLRYQLPRNTTASIVSGCSAWA